MRQHAGINLLRSRTHIDSVHSRVLCGRRKPRCQCLGEHLTASLASASLKKEAPSEAVAPLAERSSTPSSHSTITTGHWGLGQGRPGTCSEQGFARLRGLPGPSGCKGLPGRQRTERNQCSRTHVIVQTPCKQAMLELIHQLNIGDLYLQALPEMQLGQPKQGELLAWSMATVAADAHPLAEGGLQQ